MPCAPIEAHVVLAELDGPVAVGAEAQGEAPLAARLGEGRRAAYDARVFVSGGLS
jgi:hypothetical protein